MHANVRKNGTYCYVSFLLMALSFMLVVCSIPSEESVVLNEFLVTEGVALTCDME